MTTAFQWSFYRLSDGIFTGAVFSARKPAALPGNTPPGCAALPGLHNPNTQRVDLATGAVVAYQPPAPADDEWRTWSWSAEAAAWVPSPTTAALARDGRAARNQALAACDWTQIADVPLTTQQRAAWAAYRDALRDLPASSGWPDNITWPTPPVA